MIRPLLKSDYELFMQMSKEFYNSDGVSHSIPDTYHHDAFCHMMEDDRYSHCCIYEKSGKPVGYFLLSLTYSREAGGMAIWLEELYIRPEFRGMGIGGEMIDYILKKYSYAKRFRLEITHGNPAQHLYSRKGFEPFGYEQMIFEK